MEDITMFKRQIRNLNSTKPNPPRVFDVLVNGGDVSLEFKTGKNSYETMPWEDVVQQVEAAKKSGMAV